MRLFLALNIGPELRSRCYAAVAPLRAAAPGMRWASEDRLHLTLKFLGEQPETLVGPLSSGLDVVAARYEPMELAFVDVGAFPNFRRPRIVWLGVRPDPKLELLHHDVEVAGDAVGLPLEGRPFQPHVTLGRADERPPEALRTAARQVAVPEVWVVDSLDIMQSTGGRYRTLHESRFRERDDTFRPAMLPNPYTNTP